MDRLAAEVQRERPIEQPRGVRSDRRVRGPQSHRHSVERSSRGPWTSERAASRGATDERDDTGESGGVNIAPEIAREGIFSGTSRECARADGVSLAWPRGPSPRVARPSDHPRRMVRHDTAWTRLVLIVARVRQWPREWLTSRFRAGYGPAALASGGRHSETQRRASTRRVPVCRTVLGAAGITRCFTRRTGWDRFPRITRGPSSVR